MGARIVILGARMLLLGTLYKAKKCYMMIGVTHLSSGTFPQFGYLYDILVYGEEPNILFVFNSMQSHGYDANVGAYVVSFQEKYQCIYRPAMMCHFVQCSSSQKP